MRHLYLLILPLLFVASQAKAIGVLVPTDTSIPPLAIESHRVEVNIKDRTAETKVVQVFRNSTSRVLEATYTFPLPKGASVSDFALWMNGKRVAGEILEKDKAKEIYQGIVSRMKDPGLLEYVDGRLFQAKIFPIPANGTQQVEISFTSILTREGGVSNYTYPLKTGGTSASTMKDFTMTVKIESKTPIKSVYSPTHLIDINKKDDYHTVVGFEYEKAVLEKDFQLYYSLSKDEVGVDLLTYKRKGEDGYFMMMMSPKQEYSESEIIGKHVTFVIDTSGSMSGEKMESARKALIYCLQNLRDDDTFSIIRFSSDVEVFERDPKPATKEWVTKAVNFVSKMEAAGGTAINDALQLALKTKPTNSGPKLLVFLTDGSPTIGEVDPKRIAESAHTSNTEGYRIFVFGVGETVNAVLLDQLSAENEGFAEYAKPDSEIELLLTGFYSKISYPVLANLSLEVSKVKTKDLYPRAIKDLYRGQQVLLFGRYQEIGKTAVALTGTVEGKTRKFEYTTEFPAENLQNDFIPRLWAERKIGFLLEEIRVHGEQKELKEEVIKLAKEFGIVTPYTSYLVIEDAPIASNGASPTPNIPRWNNDQYWQDELEAPEDIDGSTDTKTTPKPKATPSVIDTSSMTQGGSFSTDVPTGRSYESSVAMVPGVATSGSRPKIIKKGLFGRGKKVDRNSKNYEGSYNSPDAEPQAYNPSGPADPQAASQPTIDYNASTGASGIAAAKENRSRKEYSRNENNGYSQNVAGRTFLWSGTAWIDSTYETTMKTMVIEPLSDAYFELLKLKPDLAKLLALGSEVTLVLSKDKAVVIMPGGRASIPEPEMWEFVK
jgi:Ca-activated chloride channel family protein